MLAFLRRNTVAFIALFIALGGTAYAANTVRSQDIVDGQVKTVDLANGAVTPAKMGSHSGFKASTELTSDCDGTPGTWTECSGGLSVTVPAGHSYYFEVTSDVHGDAGNVATPIPAQFCPAIHGDGCIKQEGPDWVTFWPRGVSGESQTAIVVVSPSGATNRTVTFSTAMNFSGTLLVDNEAHTTTTVHWWEA